MRRCNCVLKYLCGIILPSILLCACVSAPQPPQTTDLPPAPPTAAIDGSDTVAPEEKESGSSGIIPAANLPENLLLDSNTRFLSFCFDPLSSKGELLVLCYETASLRRYAVHDLDWIYGAPLNAEDCILLEECKPFMAYDMQLCLHGGYQSNNSLYSRARLTVQTDELSQMQLAPADQLSEGQRYLYFAAAERGGDFSVWGGSEDWLDDTTAEKLWQLCLVWDYAYSAESQRLADKEAVMIRLPSAAADAVNSTNGDGLYWCEDGITRRFSHYAGTGYTAADLFARFGITETESAASVAYSGPSLQAGALAPRETNDSAELDALFALFRRAAVPSSPYFADYRFPDAGAPPVPYAAEELFWRKMVFTTDEGETFVITHYPTESMLVWNEVTLLMLSEDDNRTLLRYTFGMTESETQEYYHAIEAYLDARREGNAEITSPGTVDISTTPPGHMSDWMNTPRPEQ